MNISLILNKIKRANKFNTETDLAVFLGISKSTLSNWRGRGSLDFEIILSKCEQLDKNWLFSEKDEELINVDKTVSHAPEKINADSDLLNVILEKYKAMAIEYGSIKKELEDLKNHKNTLKE